MLIVVKRDSDTDIGIDATSTGGDRTSDAGVVGHADTAILVECYGRYFAGTPRSVFVVAVVPGHWIIVVVVYIDTGAGVLRTPDNTVRIL